MGNTTFSRRGTRNSVLDDFRLPIENIRHRGSIARAHDAAGEDDSPDKSDETRRAYGRKRDSFSYLKSTQEFQREKAKSNFITKDYLRVEYPKMQTHENPFQEIDIALGTPRVLKKYVYDEQKLGQGKYAEFSLETVRDDNNTGKNDDREDLMKAFLQQKKLQEEKSKQLSIPKTLGETRRPSQREDRILGNESPGPEPLSPEKRRVSLLGRQNDNLMLKLEKSNESAGKSAKAFSKGVIKLESIAEKDEVRINGGLWKQGQPIKHADESHIRTELERGNNRHHSNVINKAPNVKKILIESDDEDNINEMKDIEPLMILAHQNVKPTKYIFNTKYMGEKISESDKKFLAPKLPNLFKEPRGKSPNTNEENNIGESSKIKKSTTKNPKEENDQILNYSTMNKFTDQSQRVSMKDLGTHKRKSVKLKL